MRNSWISAGSCDVGVLNDCPHFVILLLFSGGGRRTKGDHGPTSENPGLSGMIIDLHYYRGSYRVICHL